MEFKDFLLSENSNYLDQRISDILSALQDLSKNAEDMGTRHVVSNAEQIVNRIRRIIHTHWPEKEGPRLLVLRKCAAAIMRSIEKKDDLNSTLEKCKSNIEEISGGKKANDI